MDNKKINLIIIALVGILVLSLFINLQTYNAKQAVEQEREGLKRENTLLAKKIEENLRDYKRLEEKVGSLNSELNKASQEKDELQQKFDAVTKEKNELDERLKKIPATAASVSGPAAPSGPVTEDAYWGAILKTKTELEMQLASVRGELKAAQITSEQLQREKGSLDLEVNSLKREQQDSKRQLEYNQKLMDSLSQEIVREKNDKFQIETTLKEIKSENSVLRRQLRSLDSRKITLERRYADLLKDKSTLMNRLNEMETVLQDKTMQIDKLNKRLGMVQKGKEEEAPVELSTIVVRPPAETSPAAAIKYLGKVMAINKDSKFVIIDLGEDTGIKVGDIFQVYREDRPIATIEVIQTRKNISACDIKKEVTPVNTGDQIK